MTDNVRKLAEFLNESPTAFHGVKNIAEQLEKSGFEKLEESRKWKLQAGGKYYVTRNRSSVIAFTMPISGKFTSFRMAASHSDSPTFKVKENSTVMLQDKYVKLDTEVYGGPILFTWIDRPLSIAGRVMVRTDKGVESRLIDMKRDCAIIPNVPVHMNDKANKDFTPNPAVDMVPMWMGGNFLEAVAKEAGCSAEDIEGHDLFLYSRVPASVWGDEEQYISSSRLDDLECAWTSVMSLIDAGCAENHVNMCAVFDNEEVGSRTKQGAGSTFLLDVLHRICSVSGMDEEEYVMALSSSFMLSADNAHAVHPNHPELCDSVNRTWMNEGIVIKFNAAQHYTTDGVSEAVFHQICRKAGVPVQHFANRSDLRGGGTLGNVSAAHVSINTLDIGLPQLAMHSSYETAGTRDVEYMIQGMTAFYAAQIDCTEDGNYSVL